MSFAPSVLIAEAFSCHIAPGDFLAFGVDFADSPDPAAKLRLSDDWRGVRIAAAGAYRFEFWATLVSYTEVPGVSVVFHAANFAPASERFARWETDVPPGERAVRVAAATVLPVPAGGEVRVRIFSADKAVVKDGARLIVTRVT